MPARRRRFTVRLGATIAATAIAGYTAAAASGSIAAKLDFETGSFSQWSEVQSACTGGGYDASNVGNSCASVVSFQKREGSYAARFAIGPWSNGASTAPRAEAYVGRAETGAFDGQEWYYAWSTLFPSSENTGWWAKGGDWNYFTQMHGTGPVGAVFALGIDATAATPMIYFEHLTKDPADLTNDLKVAKTILGPLRFDRWYDFVMRVRWSPSVNNGLVEVWVDGNKWLTQLGVTLPPGGAYLKQGYYGGAHGATNVVYHDAMRRASALADVLGDAAPAPTPPQPAPAPTPPTPPAQPTPPVVLPPLPPPPVVVLEPPKTAKPRPKPRPRRRAGVLAETRVTSSVPRTILLWDGRKYTTARQLRKSLGARGVKWSPFLRRHPGVAKTFRLVPVRWSGLAYYSQASLARRLAASGKTYRGFASRYPARAALLDRNDRR